MKKIKLALIISIFSVFLFGQVASAVTLGEQLKGRILLAVEDKGQAWYVNPLDYKRYYLGGPDDAFALMRQLGLGVSNADFYKIAVNAPTRLLGRILLKVEDHGRAYYVNPKDRRLYYLGGSADAFALMRREGLGITNSNLAKIIIARGPQGQTTVLGPDDKEVTFTWKYNNKNYYLKRIFSTALYQIYKNTNKNVLIQSNISDEDARNYLYQYFIITRSDDETLKNLVNDLKSLAIREGYLGDKQLEFIMAFIQYIPYNHDKTSAEKPNFIYETLYTNLGVCSEKTFLSSAILKLLGYGNIIMDFPEANHSAIGILCPAGSSTYGNGYCFAETTNYFPIGAVGQNSASGQVTTNEELDNIFNAGSFGRVEYYQKVSGQTYYGIKETKDRVATLKSLRAKVVADKANLDKEKATLDSLASMALDLKIELDDYRAKQDWTNYNKTIPLYNTAATNYNTQLAKYSSLQTAYNNQANQYNTLIKSFYQK